MHQQRMVKNLIFYKDAFVAVIYVVTVILILNDILHHDAYNLIFFNELNCQNYKIKEL